MRQRRIHLVLGMHRGGTSATAGALHAMGARAGRTLIGPSAHNPAGYFEDRAVLAQMERLLAAAGSFWNDWRALDLDAVDPAVIAEIRDRLRDHVGAELTVSPWITIKDPRNARAVTVWRDLLSGVDAEVVAIHPIRHPVAVWRSLEARNGFDLGTAGRLWLRHMLDAERDSRGMRRAFVDYAAFIERPQDTLTHMNETLGTGWSTATIARGAAHLDPALQRQPTDAAAITRLRTLVPWALEAHDRLTACAAGEADDRSADLDRLAAAFESASAPFAEGFGRDQQDLCALRRTNKSLAHRLAAQSLR